jgi:hypothetical protein
MSLTFDTVLTALPPVQAYQVIRKSTQIVSKHMRDTKIRTATSHSMSFDDLIEATRRAKRNTDIKTDIASVLEHMKGLHACFRMSLYEGVVFSYDGRDVLFVGVVNPTEARYFMHVSMTDLFDEAIAALAKIEEMMSDEDEEEEQEESDGSDEEGAIVPRDASGRQQLEGLRKGLEAAIRKVAQGQAPGSRLMPVQEASDAHEKSAKEDGSESESDEE